MPGGGPVKFDEFLGLGPLAIPLPLGMPFDTARGAPDMRGIGEWGVGEGGTGAGAVPLTSFGLDWFTVLRLWRIA